MKKLIAINFIDHFVTAALMITIPLLLLARGIEIYKIGIIFSILPLVFLVVRLFFSAVADQLGTKLFFIINSVTNALCPAIYCIAASLPIFALGKVFEGIKSSSFWAVIRTETYLSSKKGEEEKNAAFLYGVRAIGTCLGTVMAGWSLTHFSFSLTLLSFFFSSLFLFLPTFLLKSKPGKIALPQTLLLLDFRKKSAQFWLVSSAILFNGMALFSLLDFVFPIFMKTQLSLSYAQIGEFLALFYLISSLATFLTLKLEVPYSQILLLQLLSFLPAVLMLPFGSQVIFPFIFTILAVGEGLSHVIFEALVATTTKGLISTSTDIGILHIPMRLSEFATVFAGGFIIEKFGYFPIFAISASSFLLFSILSLNCLKSDACKPDSWFLRRFQL
jgi:MFS family permease